MQVNRHSLHVETHGPESGAAVVLLHHGLGSVRAWKGQIPGAGLWLEPGTAHMLPQERPGNLMSA